MGLCCISVLVVLLLIACSFTANVTASPCAEIRSPSAVVLAGSSVKASCNIKEDCSLTKGQDFRVEWPYKLSSHSSKMASQDKRVHEVLISNFTNGTVMLECAICILTGCQIVAGMEIKAAYPPAVPQNLTCQLNLNERKLLCTWDPGQETSIFTNYTLHTEIRESSQTFVYVPAPGNHFYEVPRVGFPLFSQVKVQVVAVNALGQATSKDLVFDPMGTAKLDSPEILRTEMKKYGCLEYKWTLSMSQSWIFKGLDMEVKVKPMNCKISCGEQVFSKRGKPGSSAEVCGLLSGMMYESKIRVRYRLSPWSEWSRPTVATTLIKAPTGHLVTWLKILGPPKNRLYQAELYWKPSAQFRPNCMNISYSVSPTRPTSKRRNLCVTNQRHCSLKIPVDVKKLYLTATNPAGRSSPTEVAVYRHADRDRVPYLTVLPESDESLLAEWSSPVSSVVSSYTLEWKAVHESVPTTVSFETVDRNQTSMIVSGLEPYKPYEISVYPQYENAVGRPYTVLAYTKQKAPSQSPKVKLGEIRRSSVELLWDEIPIQQRNGIITSYTVFYWDDKNNKGVLDVKGKDRRVVLKGLHPSSTYSILLMTSTTAGSLNTSIASVKMPSIDPFEIVLVVIPACVGLTLLLLGAFTCFSNNKYLKKGLWPVIPDPANSSIKKWTLESLQDIPSFQEVKDPVPRYLSQFSLLSLSEKELWKGKTKSEYLHFGNWTYNGKTVTDETSNSSHDSGIYNSGSQSSQSESVPYATVVFANPYHSQPALPPAYLRSESTQPLLGEEEPSSPRPYEKTSTQIKPNEQGQFSTFQEDLESKDTNGSLWEDFPMLQSLEINVHDQV